VFANPDAAETWLEENDPESVAFEYEVMWHSNMRSWSEPDRAPIVEIGLKVKK